METRPRHVILPSLLAGVFASLLPVALAQQVASPDEQVNLQLHPDNPLGQGDIVQDCP
jgi:hypothetical protein